MTLCASCVEKASKRPLKGSVEDPDGKHRCRNHSTHPNEVARRKREGAAGTKVAKERAHKPQREGPHNANPPPAPAPGVAEATVAPARFIDFSTPDAVTATMERVGGALLAGKVHPDNAAVFVKFCEVAQKVRSPRGAVGAAPSNPKRRRIEFVDVPGHRPEEPDPVH